MGPPEGRDGETRPMTAAHERLTIRGSLDADSLAPWIIRHAARLGLQGDIRHADARQVEVDITGPVDMIDAMEMGCLLGPIDVWVDSIERAPQPVHHPK